MVHRKPEGTAKRYFDQNKQRFIPRVDFYRISANEYRSQFDTAHPKQTSKSVAFITVSGYTLITKQYTTDRDNHVMRDMLMDYFEVTEGYSEEPEIQTACISIGGVDCYEKDGTVYLKLENVARGLGFTTVATSGNEVVRWNMVHKYLEGLSVATSCNGTSYRDNCPDFIPENIFYRLAMKAKNETAERFQALVADEIIPAIRKTGTYSVKSVDPEEKQEEAGTVTVSMVETEKLIRCAEIMAGCLEGNRPYVLNILRPVIPDIDRMEREQAEVEVNGEVVKVPILEDKVITVIPRAYSKPFNYTKFDKYLKENDVKIYWLQTEIGCSKGCINNWRRGHASPIEGYRIKLCEVLGLPVGYFDRKVEKRK